MTTRTSKRFKIRRALIIGSGSVAVLASTATLYLQRPTATQRWIEELVRDHLPQVPIDTQSLRDFSRLMSERPRVRSVSATLLTTTPPSIRNALSNLGRVKKKREDLERYILTEFLINSNFFNSERGERAIVFFNGFDTVCSNPFFNRLA